MTKRSIGFLVQRAVEKACPESGRRVCQRRSRRFVVLTYYEYALRANPPAALPVEGRVLARLGWAGQTTGLFEQPSGY